jgi:hypothetical protein
MISPAADHVFTYAGFGTVISAVSKGPNGNRMLSGNSQFISLIGVCEKHRGDLREMDSSRDIWSNVLAA